MSVTTFITFTSSYILNLYTHKVWRKLKDTFDNILRYALRYALTPIKLALRARRVDAELGPEGSGKELVGKGSGTVRARLATFFL